MCGVHAPQGEAKSTHAGTHLLTGPKIRLLTAIGGVNFVRRREKNMLIKYIKKSENIGNEPLPIIGVALHFLHTKRTRAV